MFYTNHKLTDIQFAFTNELPKISQNQLKDIDNIWQNELQKNSTIFNGSHFSINSVEALNKGENLSIGLNKTQYKYRVWAKYQKHINVGMRPCAVGVVSYNPKTQEYQLLKRSSQVAAYPNNIACVAGNVDFKQTAINDFAKHVVDIALMELSEEVILREPLYAKDLNYLGLTYNQKNSFGVFMFVCDSFITGLKGNENSEIVIVKKANICEFFKQTNAFASLGEDAAALAKVLFAQT